VGEPIPASDKQRLEDTAAYLVRNPLSLKKLYLDGHKAVLYRSRLNPCWRWANVNTLKRRRPHALLHQTA
jgi:hypothetical protein